MIESNSARKKKQKKHQADLRMIAWEVTRACNLDCAHCRASAVNEPLPEEFSNEEALNLLDQIADFANPVIILTGGEPLMRPDIFEIAKYGHQLGLRMVMAPNGTLITEEVANKIREAGIQRCSISIDGSTEEIHDDLRQVKGAYRGALRGIEYLKKANVEFQINTTITQRNVKDLPNILELVKSLQANAWHIFLLVPTGRGKEMEDEEISPQEYEDTLNWFYDIQKEIDIPMKATCAPHYYRILRQRAKEEGIKVSRETHGLDAVTRGCLGGISFCFISHIGEVYPCGYLEVLAGNVREKKFREIWEKSKVFQDLRDLDKYEGKCGFCEYRRVCGGCRARAFAKTGKYLEEEPYCIYEPKYICR